MAQLAYKSKSKWQLIAVLTPGALLNVRVFKVVSVKSVHVYCLEFSLM